MRSRLTVLVAGVVAMVAMSIPGTASAATEFGDSCVADAPYSPVALFEFSAPGNPLPTAAPSGGVITKWKVNLTTEAPEIPTALKVIRQVGADSILVVGDSTGTIRGGSNSFDTRISVQAGDRLAIHGVGEAPTVICDTEGVNSHLGGFNPAVATGATGPFEEGEADLRVPVTAIPEPDVDSDGFGDETQDACPQSATVQVACPLIALDTSAKVGKKSVVVLVAGSSEGPVSVKGVVRLGKGKKVTLKAKPKTVVPGRLASFKLKFNAKLIKRLQDLEPSKKLTLKITASATNVAGLITTDKARVKLKGQG
jgi:hypothetical protein